MKKATISPMPSLKRQARYKRHLTAETKGTPFGRCIHEKQVNGRRVYLHVTKGWRSFAN